MAAAISLPPPIHILEKNLSSKEFIMIFNLLVSFKDEIKNLGLSHTIFENIKENFVNFMNYLKLCHSFFDVIQLYENNNQNIHFLSSLIEDIKNNKNDILGNLSTLQKNLVKANKQHK